MNRNQLTGQEQMPHSNKVLISSQTIEDKVYNTISTYKIPDYGIAEIAEHGSRTNGTFRRAYTMMPFEYMNKMSKDFDWSFYPHAEIGKIKEVVNKFILGFDKFREAGKGLYICSKSKGSGKTLLSCILANELLERKSINIKFIAVLDFIEMTKKGFKSDKAVEDMENIRNATVLILDDIGVQMSKEWVDSVLYRLINHRASNKLVTIFTSNIEADNLKVDERITQRIEKMTIPLYLPEVSVRKQLTEQENNNFLSNITCSLES